MNVTDVSFKQHYCCLPLSDTMIKMKSTKTELSAEARTQGARVGNGEGMTTMKSMFIRLSSLCEPTIRAFKLTNERFE